MSPALATHTVSVDGSLSPSGANVIPRLALHLDASLSAEHAGWSPGRDDPTEEGFGGFRDTW